MWVYVGSRSSGACVSLILHPSLKVEEAVMLAGQEAGLLPQEVEGMQLHEVVLGEQLERPMHHSESLLEATLRWGKWPQADRHDNYLLLKQNTFYIEALACAVPPLSVFAELQFSGNKLIKGTARFSTASFSVAKASITQYKEEDRTGSQVEMASWPVEHISWYLGAERTRNAPSNLNITFVDKNPVGEDSFRSKDEPLFGRVMSFSSRELYVKWIAALLVAEYQADAQNTGELGIP